MWKNSPKDVIQPEKVHLWNETICVCRSVNYFFGSQVNWITLRVLIVEEIVASEEEVGQCREVWTGKRLISWFFSDRKDLFKEKRIQWQVESGEERKEQRMGEKGSRISRENQMNEELLQNIEKIDEEKRKNKKTGKKNWRKKFSTDVI